MMYEPKSEVYKTLKTLNYDVVHANSAEFTKLPLITFNVISNIPQYALDCDVLSQDVSVSIDLWAEDSEELTNMLSEVESCMRSILYILEFSSEVPNVDKNILHYTTRFRKTV